MTDDIENAGRLYWWIATNGASCAIAPARMKRPRAVPTPRQMIGFPTFDDAKQAQRICLTADGRGSAPSPLALARHHRWSHCGPWSPTVYHIERAGYGWFAALRAGEADAMAIVAAQSHSRGSVRLTRRRLLSTFSAVTWPHHPKAHND